MAVLRVVAVALVASLAAAVPPSSSLAKSSLANAVKNTRRLYDPRTKSAVDNKQAGYDEMRCTIEFGEALLMCDQDELANVRLTLDCKGYDASACESPCYDTLMTALFRLENLGVDCSFLFHSYCKDSDMCETGDACVYGECRTPCANDQDCALGCDGDEPLRCCSFWDENGNEQMMCCEGQDDEKGIIEEEPMIGLRDPIWPGAIRQVFDAMCHTNANGQNCVEAIEMAVELNTCEAYQAAGCCLSSLVHCASDVFDYFTVDQMCDVDLSAPCQDCYGAPPCSNEIDDPCEILKAAGFCWNTRSDFQPYMLAFCPYACGACDKDNQCMYDQDEKISGLAATLGITLSSCDEAVAVAANLYGAPYCSGPYASVLNSYCPCACTRANNYPDAQS